MKTNKKNSSKDFQSTDWRLLERKVHEKLGLQHAKLFWFNRSWSFSLLNVEVGWNNFWLNFLRNILRSFERVWVGFVKEIPRRQIKMRTSGSASYFETCNILLRKQQERMKGFLYNVGRYGINIKVLTLAAWKLKTTLPESKYALITQAFMKVQVLGNAITRLARNKSEMITESKCDHLGMQIRFTFDVRVHILVKTLSAYVNFIDELDSATWKFSRMSLMCFELRWKSKQWTPSNRINKSVFYLMIPSRQTSENSSFSFLCKYFVFDCECLICRRKLRG